MGDNDGAMGAVAVSALPQGDLIAPGSENERVILRGPSRIRTGDGGFAIHCCESTSDDLASTSVNPPLRLARALHHLAENDPLADPELARVVAAWPTLPASIRAAMLALASVNPSPTTPHL